MENAVHFIILAAEAVLSVVLPPLIMKIKHKKDICSSAMRTLSIIAAVTAFLITGEFLAVYESDNLNFCLLSLFMMFSAVIVQVDTQCRIIPNLCLFPMLILAGLYIVKHGNYKWRWEKLENYLSYGGGKSDTEPYTVADTDMFYNYLKDEYNASQYENWKACIGFWDGNYDFWNGSDINKFLTYCREHGKGDNYPVYFPGSVTLDQGTPITMNGAIVVAKDFKMNTMTTQNGSGSGNRIAVVSLNGDITLGNSGMKNVINGAVIDLKQGGRIQLNGGGVINGGVISKGTIVMDGAWNVTADTEWQGAILPKSSKTKMLIRLK